MKIGIGGSAANPPHLGHLHLIKGLIEKKKFDKIFWIPSGVRRDKVGFVDPDHRVAMTLLTFPTDWFWKEKTDFSIKFDDVYGGNTPTIRVLEKYKEMYPNDEVVWFTGADSVVPQDRYKGKCEIEAMWIEGEKLYKNHNFLVLPRPGYMNPKDLNLPDNFEVFNKVQLDINSTEIRERIRSNKPISGLVTEGVEKYIKKNSLYKP